jgi:dephospho-CoA kinase
MTIIGLTGNYGMGKSTVARMFKDFGAEIIDTDAIVRDLLDDNDIQDKIKNSFGDDIVQGGKLDKKLLSDMVFGNPHLRISLEDILHPAVFKKVDREITEITAKKKGETVMVVVEAPVIFERGYQNRFDIIITVFTSEDTAISRLKEKGVSEYEAERRLKTQFPSQMKASKSDYSIDNNGNVEDTRKQVGAIYEALLARERKHGNN